MIEILSSCLIYFPSKAHNVLCKARSVHLRREWLCREKWEEVLASSSDCKSPTKTCDSFLHWDN